MYPTKFQKHFVYGIPQIEPKDPEEQLTQQESNVHIDDAFEIVTFPVNTKTTSTADIGTPREYVTVGQKEVDEKKVWDKNVAYHLHQKEETVDSDFAEEITNSDRGLDCHPICHITDKFVDAAAKMQISGDSGEGNVADDEGYTVLYDPCDEVLDLEEDEDVDIDSEEEEQGNTREQVSEPDALPAQPNSINHRQVIRQNQSYLNGPSKKHMINEKINSMLWNLHAVLMCVEMLQSDDSEQKTWINDATRRQLASVSKTIVNILEKDAVDNGQ